MSKPLVSRWIGIDPAPGGGIVALDQLGQLFDEQAIPTIAGGESLDIRMLMDRLLPIIADGTTPPEWVIGINDPGAPARGSRYDAGRRLGLVEGVCRGIGAQVNLIAPRTWHKIAVGQLPDTARLPAKARAMTIAQTIFPTLELRPQGRRRPQPGVANAALIAWAIWKTWKP